MVFNVVWEQIHRERSWGAYPKEELVRWVARNFTDTETKFLDFGCGQGSSSWFLAREGFDVTAYDGSVSAVLKTHQRLAKDDLKCRGVVGCMTKTPLGGGEFDAVVDVVSSVHNSWIDLRLIWEHEIPRLLKPEGKIFTVMPTLTCYKKAFDNAGDITFVSKDDIQTLLARQFTGVKILRSSYELDTDCSINLWIISATRLA